MREAKAAVAAKYMFRIGKGTSRLDSGLETIQTSAQDYLVQVSAICSLEIEERGSVCGRTWWLVWQELHTAVTVRPLLKRPSPWMDWL